MKYVLSFRVRRVYFDDILIGKKKDEIRKRSPFWNKRVEFVANLIDMPYPSGICFPPKKVLGVFLCGKDVSRFWLRGVELHPNAESALHREPSEQGKKDLGSGEVWRFLIGERY